MKKIKQGFAKEFSDENKKGKVKKLKNKTDNHKLNKFTFDKLKGKEGDV